MARQHRHDARQHERRDFNGRFWRLRCKHDGNDHGLFPAHGTGIPAAARVAECRICVNARPHQFPATNVVYELWPAKGHGASAIFTIYQLHAIRAEAKLTTKLHPTATATAAASVDAYFAALRAKADQHTKFEPADTPATRTTATATTQR